MTRRRRLRRESRKPSGTSLGLAIASLSLGCLSILLLFIPATYYAAIPAALIGLVLGIVALGTARGHVGLPVAGFAASLIALAVTVPLTVMAERHQQEQIDEIRRILSD